jgi:tRNA U34 5-carboxymethylaminomethyl modifying GTPase MnmE/TrmE
MYIFDTIAAISTPYGKGGVAMIRISGNESLNIALNNKPVTNTTQEQQERKQPREVMYLFEEQNIIPHKLQETPKIKKKKR